MKLNTIKKETIWFFLLTIPIALFVGSRGATPDTQTYINIFKYISSYELLSPKEFYLESGMEIGFGWYSWLISSITNSSLLLLTIFSILNFFFIFKTAQILKIPYLFCLLFYLPTAYFFMQQFMQMRQGLAISIAIFAIIKLMSNKSHTITWILLLVSITNHQSVLAIFAFTILFYVINKSKWLQEPTNIKISLTIVLLFSIICFKYIFLEILSTHIGRLRDYSTTNYAEQIALLSLPNIRTMLLAGVILCFSSASLLKDIRYKFLLYLIIVALAIRIGFAEFAILSGRLSTAFSYAEIFVIPMLLLNRFHTLHVLIIAIVYFILQITITLGFQAPYLFKMYYLPLY